MKILFLIIAGIILLLPGQALALKATTVKISVACVSKEALDEMRQFVASGDRDSFNAYIEVGRCIILGDGYDVTVTGSPGMFGGISIFVYKGIKFWTNREGLRNYRAE